MLGTSLLSRSLALVQNSLALQLAFKSFHFLLAPAACFIPSEVYQTYLQSYRIAASSGQVFFSSFVVICNFNAMQVIMKKIGLTLGFYGVIAVLGWFRQLLLFLLKANRKTLEDVDLIFETPTIAIIKESISKIRENFKDIMHLRFRKVTTEVEAAE
jgi:hypothetical protein